MSDDEKSLVIVRMKAVFFAVGATWATLEEAHDAAADYQADLIAAGLGAIGPLDKLDGTGSSLYVGKVPPELPVPMPAGATLIIYNSNDYYPPPDVIRAKVAARRKARKGHAAK